MVKILIVVDDIHIAHSLSDVFELMEYDVQLAHDGLEGLKQIKTELPDIILSDVQMPNMDGFEFLQAVRKNRATETIPFIFLTARSERDSLRQGMMLGADDFVTKPFAAQDIVQTVEATLRKYKTRRKLPITTNIIYAVPQEVRMPLQVILGYAELMKMDIQQLSPDEIQQMFEMIIKSGMQLHRTIENTLAYAQIELIASDSEKQQHLRNHTLSQAVDIIERSIIPLAEKWGRQGDIDLQLENQVLNISAENFARIIEELVDNAFKFSDDATPVTIRTIITENIYKILIQDKGRGMSSDQIKQVGATMPFERVLYGQHGAGLGLVIVKRLIDLHHGSLHIDSVKGDGTLITIEFTT